MSEKHELKETLIKTAKELAYHLGGNVRFEIDVSVASSSVYAIYKTRL